MVKKEALGAHTMSMVLVHLAMLAAVLANFAVAPLLFPAFQPEGAKPPVDETLVRDAAARLMQAGGALWWASILIGNFDYAGKLISSFSIAAVAYAAFRAVEVVGVISLWARHLHGSAAASYSLAVAAPSIFIVSCGGLHVQLYFKYK